MIFCVEDDNSIRDLILYTLKSVNMDALGFADGESFFEGLKREIPSLIILDIMLPKEDGISIMKKLKSDVRTKDIPIIIATAKGSEFDKIVGLDAGADDYLVKPFGMMEMVSRIKAVLRRTKTDVQGGIIKNQEIEINTSKREVKIAQEIVTLTLKEYELLVLFLSKINKVLSREELLLSVWGSDFIGESRTIDVHIGTLRNKIGKYGKHIKTVRGVGYIWEDTGEEEYI